MAFTCFALPEREQGLFSGVRNTFYRVANIAAQGGLVILVGRIQRRTSRDVIFWSGGICRCGGDVRALTFITASFCRARRVTWREKLKWAKKAAEFRRDIVEILSQTSGYLLPWRFCFCYLVFEA